MDSNNIFGWLTVQQAVSVWHVLAHVILLLSQEAATMIFFQFLYACRHLKFLCLQPETLPLLLVCLFSSYLCISLDNHFCFWIDILSQAFFLEFRVY